MYNTRVTILNHYITAEMRLQYVILVEWVLAREELEVYTFHNFLLINFCSRPFSFFNALG